MKNKKDLIALIQRQGVLPLFFHEDVEVSIHVLSALYRGGVRAIEYTNRGGAALENFKALRDVCDNELKDMSLGIGTIKNKEEAESFIQAGADFIVSPGLVEEVAEAADKENLLWAPGCMTPSEIIRAESMGAKLIKLFPGSQLGPGFVKAIKALFPDLLFMPTGGVDVTEENLSGWFKSGVCAVGMGSKLVRKDLLASKAYDEIKEATEQTMQFIQSLRKNL